MRVRKKLGEKSGIFMTFLTVTLWIAYFESMYIVMAWLGGDELIVCRIAYTSPDWLDWVRDGTLRLAFLGLFSVNHMPLLYSHNKSGSHLSSQGLLPLIISL